MKNKLINEFEIYLGAVCSGTMVTILFVQVIARYVFNNAFSWAEELAIIFFILSIYFGATAAVRRNQHLRLAIVLDSLGPQKRLILEIIDNVFFSLFNIIILWGILPIIQKLKLNGTSTAVTDIPKWIIYSFLPVLFVLMLVRLYQDSIEKYKKIKELNNQPQGSGQGGKGGF